MKSSRRLSIANGYAVVALLFGLFFVVATPPFGAGDETAHFERSYEIATGAVLGAEGLPEGMQAFIDDAFGRVKSGEPVSDGDFRRWRAIALQRDDVVPYPEPLRKVLRLHSPLCYAHFAPATAVGIALGLPPIAIFYLLRLIALLVGVALVFFALRRAPATLRPFMAFIALLPTAVVYFGAANIESLLVGLGFYFFATVAAHAADAEKKLNPRDIAHLALVAFLLGQFKTGYLFLPLAAIILPAAKFDGARARVLSLAFVCVPGVVASLFWAYVVKDAILGDLVYSTIGDNHVEPSAQLAHVIANPIEYLSVVTRTLFASDAPGFAWRTFLAVGGWTNIPIAAPIYALLTVGLFLVWMSGPKPPPALSNRFAATAQLTIFAATAFAILTLVYFQWNGVGAPTIEGFQGRYLFAAMPLLAAVPPARLSFLDIPAQRGALAFGVCVIGLAAMSIAVVDQYY